MFDHDTTEIEQANLDDDALTLDELTEIMYEIEEQPYWRHTADKEMDYADGNQLETELLNRMKQIGIPPAVEDMIGPALQSVEGFELQTRTDWRVKANGDTGSDDVADALNFKLNQAERLSKADKACSDAFRPQIGCGLGWVEVKREQDPFKFPYRCIKVHRNEIHWDMKSVENDLSDARWLRRTRWIHPKRLINAFPQHAELIQTVGRYGGSWWQEAGVMDGGESTGLKNAWLDARSYTISEQYWYNPTSKEINVAEVWYRRWVRVPVLKFSDGRVVEYDSSNMNHDIAIFQGLARVELANISKVRRSYWLGPHLLFDGPTPYSHHYFPYVPFWGAREDNTNIPYGFVRRMKFSQDSINSGISKLRWGMSVTRVERTKGAVDMTDEQLRRQVARPDADIVLNANHMAKQGSRFEVKRDFELSQQHFQLINDNRAAIERVSNITSGFQGKKGNATSGKQEQLQIEQSNQTLMKIMDNFREARTLIGEMLLSMIVEDMGTREQTVIIEGDAIREDRTVVINKPEVDEMGYPYVSNDVQRIRLKVVLDDVPSSTTFREQQLNALSEITKSLSAEIQTAVLPYVMALTDIPFKKDIIESIRQATQAQTPEQIEQRIQEAVKQALAQAGNDIKLRELELKEKEMVSRIRNTDAKTVQTGVQSSYSAMQSAAQVAQMPQIAPIADVIMQSAGYQSPNPMGDDPNYPTAEQTAARDLRSPYIEGKGAQLGSEGLAEVQQNTSPMSPPVPQEGSSPMQGIETVRTSDNLA
ncbi:MULTISPECIES: portal protein [Acinetobacter]|uniref:portal protein n=1 Tax=Acinetobacter TaxID=469 RepID=UPI0002AED58D|nr:MULTISPECIES: hypothetical protein [Acinetobacter]ELW85723.1 hypothetical protein ACINWC743_A0720 [Acinetobacter sp. WC-743]MBJ8427854.1 hypothetical protein [Acinetobacter bereziniae]